jgi:hypothetical protein
VQCSAQKSSCIVPNETTRVQMSVIRRVWCRSGVNRGFECSPTEAAPIERRIEDYQGQNSIRIGAGHLPHSAPVVYPKFRPQPIVIYTVYASYVQRFRHVPARKGGK